MSVITINPKEILMTINTIDTLSESNDFIKKSPYFIEYNKKTFKEITPTHFIGIALKYGMFATHFAFAVNYKTSADIEWLEKQLDVECEKVVNPQAAIEKIGSIIYNSYTNAGSCFLEEKWMGFLESYYEYMKEVYPEPKVDIPSAWIN